MAKRPNGRLSSVSLANNRLMDITQLALTWVGWPNGEKVALSASHRKSTQVHAGPGQTESQVDPGFQLASTYDSVWPGLYSLMIHQVERKETIIAMMFRCLILTTCRIIFFLFSPWF